MRSIKARFKKEEKKYPFHGAYIHLIKAVRNQKFSRKRISKSFNELMPKEEYNKNEKKELVDFLDNASNILEES